MPFDPDKHHRRSIRLRDYDYSQPGAYYVTICTYEREHLFGRVKDGKIALNEYGKAVWECWRELPKRYVTVRLDAFVIMPNHIHAIIILTAGLSPRASLSEIVRNLKTYSAKWINRLRRSPQAPVWQRNYYEHIVRDNQEWEAIREYIRNNPVNWEQDIEYTPE